MSPDRISADIRWDPNWVCPRPKNCTLLEVLQVSSLTPHSSLVALAMLLFTRAVYSYSSDLILDFSPSCAWLHIGQRIFSTRLFAIVSSSALSHDISTPLKSFITVSVQFELSRDAIIKAKILLIEDQRQKKLDELLRWFGVRLREISSHAVCTPEIFLFALNIQMLQSEISKGLTTCNFVFNV